jgi:transposase
MAQKRGSGVEKLTPLELWTRQLDLDGLEVVHERHERPDDPVRLTVVSTARVAMCPHGHRPSESEHLNRNSNPNRDLPHGPRAVELIVHTRQFHCPHCARYFTPPCLHVAPGTHATAYVHAAEEVFGNRVRVTIDRFHVIKNSQERLTEARREIPRGLGKDAAKELKGTRGLWQTNPENLTAEQRQQSEQLKARFPG